MKKIICKIIPVVIGIIIGLFLSLYLARTALYHLFSREIKQTNELMRDENFREQVEALGMTNVWREVKLWADKKPIMSPKMEELLTLQFGHSVISKITDAEAQTILDATHDYIQMKAWSDAPVWEVYAICAMKGLTPKDPEEYEKESIAYFLNEYKSGEIPQDYKKFADKVYEYLMSEKVDQNK